MPNRRDFIRNAAGATAGLLMSGHRLADAGVGAQVGAPPGKRREVSIGGRRVKTVDVHAHCFVPEVWDLVKDTPLAATAKANLTGNIALGNPQRLIDMDAQGIDYQAINVNAWGYAADRALARDLVALQNEKISQWCAQAPGSLRRAWRRSRCSIPTSRPSSWTRRSRSWDCAAPPSAAASKARSCPIASSIRSGPRRRSSACCCSCTRSRRRARRRTRGCRGRAGLGNTIGNPLETTVFLSHLIFEGTLDRFPGPEDLRRARRRLPGVVQRPVGRAVRARPAAAAPTARRSRRSRASTSGGSCSSTR